MHLDGGLLECAEACSVIAFQRVADDPDAEVADAADATLAVVADDTIADQMIAHDRG